MAKTIQDFLVYAEGNLAWFAFNFVLVTMPIACMSMLNQKSENLDIPGATGSYQALLICVCVANFL